MALRLPGRLGHDGLARAFAIAWSHRTELAFLPLAHVPEVLVQLRVELHRADDGVEAALLQLGGHGRAVDLAHAFDRLLEGLQAGIGDRAGPAVRLATGSGLVALEVVLD